MQLHERKPLRPEDELGLTIADCDDSLARYQAELHEYDGDPERSAIARYEIDRWLDRRLALMGAFPEQ